MDAPGSIELGDVVVAVDRAVLARADEAPHATVGEVDLENVRVPTRKKIEKKKSS